MRVLLLVIITLQLSYSQDSLVLEKAQAFYDQGKEYYYDGEYELAERAFDSCLIIWKEVIDAPHNLLFKTHYRIAGAHSKMRNYEQAEKHLDISLDQATTLFGEESDQVSRVLNDYGILYSRMRKFSKSIEWNQKSMDIKKKLYGHDSKEVAYTRMNNSNNYYSQGNYVKCINELKEILKIYNKELEPNDQNYNRVYLTLSQAYRKRGELDKAMIYAEKAVEIKLMNYDDDHPSLAKYYDNLAKVQAALMHLEQSKSNFKKSEKIYEKHGSNEDLGGHLNDAARVYMHSGSFEIAMEMFEKSAKLFRGDERKVAIANANIGISKFYLGKHQEGIQILENALVTDPSLDNYIRLAEWKIVTRDLKGAKVAYEKALALLEEGDLLSEVRLQVIYSKLLVNKNLNGAWVSIENAIQNLTQMRRHYMGSAAKNFINEELESIFDYAVELSILKYRENPDSNNINNIYKTIEMAKSASFWDDLSEENAAYYGKVPLEVLEEIEILKREGDEKLLELEEKMRQLEQDYPLYYKRKYTLDFPELKVVQSQLNEEICIIDYYVLEDSIIAVVVSENDVQLLMQANESEIAFQKEWEYLKHFPISRISIIPHRFINFVSFEEIINPATNNYFLFDYAFSYQVNVESLFRSGDSAAKLNYLGIAPTWTGIDTESDVYREAFVPLPGASMEVDKAATIFKGKLLKGEDAKEASFYSHAPDYSLIHFATHAQVDPANELNSFLFFNSSEEEEDGVLHTDEIMNTHLNAELVILSACETGNGGIKSGEGVMSLARAFQYAGAKSVLMSLWRANDHSAQPIILDFIKNYKEGMTKDVALQQSKIKYLSKADPLMRDEFYWAGFMINGDLSAIESSRSWIINLLILVLIICSLFVLFKFV